MLHNALILVLVLILTFNLHLVLILTLTHPDVVCQLCGAVLTLLRQVDAIQVLQRK